VGNYFDIQNKCDLDHWSLASKQDGCLLILVCTGSLDKLVALSRIRVLSAYKIYKIQIIIYLDFL
jgi:hypothetical protein